jgi:hypothetical protein
MASHRSASMNPRDETIFLERNYYGVCEVFTGPEDILPEPE